MSSTVDAGPGTQLSVLSCYERLRAFYGDPAERALQDPLSELIQTILSQNTADVNSDRAYERLVARFDGDWEAVRRAPVEEVADAIRVGGLAGIKAGRIQRVLSQIAERATTLDLEFLRELPLEEARAFLRGLEGVGPKTAACVLLFSCGKPAFPVDTHVHRVSQRLGLVPARASAEQAHMLLDQAVPAELVYPFHMLLVRHGRQICKAKRPHCPECPVLEFCPFGRGSASGGGGGPAVGAGPANADGS
ncbi:MAG: endonuclease III [Chloroflexi bacterium]|nr:endonuclease III [Chloroflexota bacterium]